MTYVVGRFSDKGKLYVWKNDKDLDINIGDNVIVESSMKLEDNSVCNVCVEVVGVFKSSDLTLYNRHKSIIRKLNN